MQATMYLLISARPFWVIFWNSDLFWLWRLDYQALSQIYSFLWKIIKSREKIPWRKVSEQKFSQKKSREKRSSEKKVSRCAFPTVWCMWDRGMSVEHYLVCVGVRQVGSIDKNKKNIQLSWVDAPGISSFLGEFCTGTFCTEDVIPEDLVLWGSFFEGHFF